MSQVKNSQSYIDETRANALLEKWSPVLDYSSSNVKTIEDDHTRLNTAILLENQENWCVEEANQSGGAGVFNTGSSSNGGTGGDITPMTDGAYAAGDARLPKILIPMIRRTFPELITNEIVGVQPMSGPVGLAFALRYKYQSAALGSGPEFRDNSSGVTGNAGPASTTGKEVGYQFLDSRFTGTSSADLTGSSDAGWAFDDADAGVAKALANYELTSEIPQMEISFEKTAVEAGTRRLCLLYTSDAADE